MKLSILVIGVVISIVGILLAIDNTTVTMLGARITVYPYLGIGLIARASLNNGNFSKSQNKILNPRR